MTGFQISNGTAMFSGIPTPINVYFSVFSSCDGFLFRLTLASGYHPASKYFDPAPNCTSHTDP